MTLTYFLSKWNSIQSYQAQLSFFKHYLLTLYRNKEVVDFIDQLLSGMNSNSKKIGILLYCKKILKKYDRFPSREIAECFPEEYDKERAEIEEDQITYEPVKWIEAEIEFISSYSKIQQEFVP